MAKLVKLTATDNQVIYVNSETVRIILPSGANSRIVYGDQPGGMVEVKGDPQTVAAELIG